MNTHAKQSDLDRRALLTELQSTGIALEGGFGERDERQADAEGLAGAPARRGGAGPSDHRALSIGDTTVMVPVGSTLARNSRFRLRVLGADGPAPARALITRDGEVLTEVQLGTPPRFQSLHTADGIPYSSIALLHSRGVLASTVLQSCVRYADPEQACRFCAIGTSLRAGRTLARKSPAQLAEVAEAAVRLDGIEQVVLTTGTPGTPDRGAAHLAACAWAIKQAVPGLPIQAQCEPPDDPFWYGRMHDAGVDSLGLHLEAVEPAVRARVLPGKAEVSVERYFDAFRAAVAVFGRGQVQSYLIAGLGDAPESLVAIAARMLESGVYPFVVPFVPIAGAPMADQRPPSPAMMQSLYDQIGRLVKAHGLLSRDMKAGCGKCGACSSLSAYEEPS